MSVLNQHKPQPSSREQVLQRCAWALSKGVWTSYSCSRYLLAASPAARASAGCACRRSMANASATDGFTAAPAPSKTKPKVARISARDAVLGVGVLDRPSAKATLFFFPPLVVADFDSSSCRSSPSSPPATSGLLPPRCLRRSRELSLGIPPRQKAVIWVVHVLGSLPTLAKKFPTSFLGISPSRSSSSSLDCDGWVKKKAQYGFLGVCAKGSSAGVG